MSMSKKFVAVAKWKAVSNVVVAIAEVSYDSSDGRIYGATAKLFNEADLIRYLNANGNTIPYLKISRSAQGKPYISRIDGTLDCGFDVYKAITRRNNTVLIYCPVHVVNGATHGVIVSVFLDKNNDYCCMCDINVTDDVEEFADWFVTVRSSEDCYEYVKYLRGGAVATVTGPVIKNRDGFAEEFLTPTLDIDEPANKDLQYAPGSALEAMDRLKDAFGLAFGAYTTENADADIWKYADADAEYTSRNDELDKQLSSIKKFMIGAFQATSGAWINTEVDPKVREVLSQEIKGTIDCTGCLERIIDILAFGATKLSSDDEDDRLSWRAKLVNEFRHNGYARYNVADADESPVAEIKRRLNDLIIDSDYVVATCLAQAAVSSDHEWTISDIEDSRLMNLASYKCGSNRGKVDPFFNELFLRNIQGVANTYVHDQLRIYRGLNKLVIMKCEADRYATSLYRESEFGHTGYNKDSRGKHLFFGNLLAIIDDTNKTLIWAGSPLTVNFAQPKLLMRQFMGKARLSFSNEGVAEEGIGKLKCVEVEKFDKDKEKIYNLTGPDGPNSYIKYGPWIGFAAPVLFTGSQQQMLFAFKDGLVLRCGVRIGHTLVDETVGQHIQFYRKHKVFNDTTMYTSNGMYKIPTRADVEGLKPIPAMVIMSELRKRASREFMVTLRERDASDSTNSFNTDDNTAIAIANNTIGQAVELIRKEASDNTKGAREARVEFDAIRQLTLLALAQAGLNGKPFRRLAASLIAHRQLLTNKGLFEGRAVSLGYLEGTDYFDHVIPADCYGAVRQIAMAMVNRTASGKVRIEYDGTPIKIRTLGDLMLLHDMLVIA